MRIFRPIIFALLVCLMCFSAFAQTENTKSANMCSQDNTEKLELIKKAEENQYHVRHIYIVGNTYTRHRTFRERWDENFSEGSIFTGESLMNSIKGTNKLRTINLIGLDNVKVRLEENDARGWNAIDFEICIEQKRK